MRIKEADKEEIKKYIQQRLAKAMEVIQSHPSPTSVLRCRTSHPEIIRTDVDDFLHYNTESARTKLRTKKVYSPQEETAANEAIDWLCMATKRHKGKEKLIVQGIVTLYAIKGDVPSYGYRDISRDLLKLGVRLSYSTVRRRYIIAIDDIYYHLVKKDYQIN